MLVFVFFFYGASACCQAMASPISGYRTTELLRGDNITTTPNPQPRVPGHLSLSGISLTTCPAWVAVQADKLPSAQFSSL